MSKSLGRNTEAFSSVTLSRWKYLGGQKISGGGSTSLTLPNGATIIVIKANGGDVYYGVNANNASAESSGFSAGGVGDVIVPISNLEKMPVYAAAGTIHVQYYAESR